jgi:hypothetical protein
MRPLPAEGTRVARCSEICIRLASRQPRIRTHWILVNSRSPEALISHDSALVQSTSVAGTILDYSSFLTEMSNWTCVGHFIRELDIEFENLHLM